MSYGLTTAEAKAMALSHGTNALSELPRATFWEKLTDNFRDPIIEILCVAMLANICFTMCGYGDWLETLGIALAIVLATLVATVSEYKNESAFQKLQDEASRIKCRVWRDGVPVELPIDDIVEGDAVILQAGDRVPVDGILLDGEVRLDQSALNGESDEAEKNKAPKYFSFDDNTDFLDPYRLYRGSVVVSGTGVLRAEKIGDFSVYGQLTRELQTEERTSPLKLKLEGLAKQISKYGYIAAGFVALASFALKAWRQEHYFEQALPLIAGDAVQSLILGIVIIVMAVPEGLPLMIAIVSSLNMKKMLDDNVLVRKLVGIETAGSLNLLFTDKTGTITKGKLEVVSFLDAERREYASFEDLPKVLKKYTYQNVTLNTSATVTDDAILGGNMTEVALSNYIGGYREQMPKRLRFVPFNSTDKFSMAVTADKEPVLVKGAPEQLLARVNNYWHESGMRYPMPDSMKQSMDYKMGELARQSIRMLALCTLDSKVKDLPESGLTLVGIVCIRDDVRPEAVEAIAAVQHAGVQIVMITGDRRETATAIAKDAGLLQHPDEVVWTSSELAEMTDDEVKVMLPDLRVVARALPSDKSRLVRIAQELNKVVGMTGDGVNDSPALKRADVGFAMGSGTEVAKEAGDIVILDDNFLSIKNAILYGRTIYNSISKFITFQLMINFSAVLINVLAPLFRIDRPLTIIQILWINLVMDTLAALAFGGEPALEKYLAERPKRRNESIVSKIMLRRILFGGAVMTVVALWGFLYRQQIFTDGVFFATYIFMAVANAFVVRADGCNVFKGLFRNRGFLPVMLLIVAVQVLMMAWGGTLLRVAAFRPGIYPFIVVVAVMTFVVNLIGKAVIK